MHREHADRMKAILLAVAAVTFAALPQSIADVTISVDDHASELAAAERDEAAASVALAMARENVAQLRARWDEAVAGDHPVPAGRFARLHFEAMQIRTAAQARWTAATARVDALRAH
jgi:hypothetical protein